MKKKIVIGFALIIMLLCMASPALSLSLGASPTRVAFEVPGNGSTTIDIQLHYFDGDVQISLVDIPLRIEPEVVSVEASENPVTVRLTIYGDESLGSQIYDGYIRLIAVSGGAATGGVQIITKVTHITEDTPVETKVNPTPIVIAPNPTANETTSANKTEDVVITITHATGEPTVKAVEEPVVEEVLPVENKALTSAQILPPASTLETGFTVLQTIGIAAGAVIVASIIRFLIIKRRR